MKKRNKTRSKFTTWWHLKRLIDESFVATLSVVSDSSELDFNFKMEQSAEHVHVHFDCNIGRQHQQIVDSSSECMLAHIYMAFGIERRKTNAI